MTKEEILNLSYVSPIVFYDGVCHLCHGSINFLIKHDKKNALLFSYLQSDTAKNIFGVDFKAETPESIYLLDKGEIYIKSTGVLRALRYTSGWPSFLFAFIIVPSFIRNVIYDYIAKHRYQWFGQHKSCLLPTSEIKSKFID